LTSIATSASVCSIIIGRRFERKGGLDFRISLRFCTVEKRHFAVVIDHSFYHPRRSYGKEISDFADHRLIIAYYLADFAVENVS
jgi:hypothetical protein